MTQADACLSERMGLIGEALGGPNDGFPVPESMLLRRIFHSGAWQKDRRETKVETGEVQT